MRVAGSIGDQVAGFLSQQPLLTVIRRDELYNCMGVISDGDKRSVAAALDYYAANTGVSGRGSGRSRPKLYYAVRTQLAFAPNKQPVIIYLSLPGIPRELLRPDIARTHIDSIITRLQTKYGKSTVNYWCRSAQRRSVELGRQGMERAKLRDVTCRLCVVADQLCKEAGQQSTWLTAKKITACHIVARKTVFWTILNDIDGEYHNIFSDTATDEFRKRLRADKWHSDSNYIAGLCEEHDSHVLSVLAAAAV